MGKKRRGRDRLVTCDACKRQVPRNKAVEYVKTNIFSTDLKGEENVTYRGVRVVYYCISCAKHRKIFEKKKKIAERRRRRNQE